MGEVVIDTAVGERDADTGFYVGYVPGCPGAHSQGETLEELRQNLREVVEMLLGVESVDVRQIVVR